MLRGSFYYIRARRVASTDCSKQWNRIDTQFERKYTKDTSMCIYIIYILYTLDANRYNLFHFHYLGQRLHFEFLSEFFLLTSRLPAPLFILFYLASSRCNSLPPYVSIAQVEGEGGGEDNASDTTYFTQCLHPCRVSVWSRIHVSVFVAGYSSAIEILPSSVVSGSWGEVENGRELYRNVLLCVYIYILENYF